MKIKLRLTAALLSVMLLFCSGCGEKKTVENIVAETVGGITNIDPQIAASGTELEIVYNLFTGLMQHDESGKLVTAAASAYKKSDDGKTLTFELSDNYAWQDGKPLSAGDFVFAFRRAADPATEAPYAFTLYSVKNFEKVHNGELKKEKLGVKAIDDKTLEIKLQYADTDFLELLTTAICMPCREDFVEKSAGYYGLKDSAVLTNGSYIVSDWNDTYIQLSPKEKKSTIPDVYMYFNDREKVIENVKNDDTDYITADSALYTEFKKSNFNMDVTRLSDKAYSLLANKERASFNDDIIKALMSTVDFSLEKYENDEYGVKKSCNILPDSVTADIGEIKRKTLSDENATELFRNGCEALQIERIFPSFGILYVADEVTEYAVKQIAAAWQSKLGVNVNIVAVDSEEILNYRIINNDFDFAVVRTESISCCAAAYLRQLTTESIFKDLSYCSQKLNGDLKKLAGLDEKKKGATLKKIVESIANEEYLYPLYTASKIVCTKSEYSFDYCRKQALVSFAETDYKNQ